MRKDRILLLCPPSPPYMNVMRDYAGGYGVAFSTLRSSYGHEGGSAPYVSAMYAAAILHREGYDVRIIDCQAEGLGTDAITAIRQAGPRAVVAEISLPSLHGDLAFLGTVRAAMPDVAIIGVGTVCKALYRELLRFGYLTAVVRGDAEVVVPAVVSAVSAGSELNSVPGIAYAESSLGTTVTPEADALKDLNGLPMPLYDRMQMGRYSEPSWGSNVPYMAILDGRGCPHRCCSYCPYPFGFGRRLLLREPELVVDEIAHLQERFGTEAFVFRNQSFTMVRTHAEGICNEILRRRLRVRWLCETRLDSVDADLLGLMRSAGCERVHYGLETGDPEMFAKVGKPGCDLERLGSMVEATRKAGMLAKLNVVVGLPGESWQSVNRTIRTVRRLNPDVVMAALITPYPGTDMFESARRSGFLLTEEWSEYTGFRPVMRTEHLSGEDLLEAQRMVDRCLDRTSLPVRTFRKAFRMARDLLDRKQSAQDGTSESP